MKKKNEVKAWTAKLNGGLLSDYVHQHKFQVKWDLNTYFNQWESLKIKIVPIIIREVKP